MKKEQIEKMRDAKKELTKHLFDIGDYQIHVDKLNWILRRTNKATTFYRSLNGLLHSLAEKMIKEGVKKDTVLDGQIAKIDEIYKNFVKELNKVVEI